MSGMDTPNIAKLSSNYMDAPDTTCAYAFELNEQDSNRQTGSNTGTETGATYGLSAGFETDNSYVQIFKTALDCRRALAVASSRAQVLITENSFEVSALNLAAALHKDNDARDIYIQSAHPTGLFISRSSAAGVRGIVDETQARALVRLSPTAEAIVSPTKVISATHKAISPPTKPIRLDSAPESADQEIPAIQENRLIQNSIRDDNRRVRDPESSTTGHIDVAHSEDLGWLEDVLALDELDELGASTTNIPPVVPAPAIQTAHYTHLARTSQNAQVDQPAPSAPHVQSTPSGPCTQPVPSAPLAQSAPGISVTCERPVDISPNTSHIQAPTQSCLSTGLLSPEQSGALASAFVSGRGGVGKSSLAVLTATQLLRRGFRVVLLDLDLQFGDLSYLLGSERGQCLLRLDIDAIINGQVHIPHLDEGLLLIESPTRPEMAEEIVAVLPGLLATLKQAADALIINTSCLWDEMAAVLARSCDQLFFLMDQRATSVSGCRQAAELCVRLQIPSTRFLYLLNRSSKNAPITTIDASLAVGGAEVYAVADGGREVDELLSLGLPFELLSGFPVLAQSIDGLAQAALGKALAPSVPKSKSVNRRIRNAQGSGSGNAVCSGNSGLGDGPRHNGSSKLNDGSNADNDQNNAADNSTQGTRR
ncbi:MAG: P-loop NTPase [Coriobacteriales bacterium]|jgi:MinD-like ATPase involved in chromosome partitioning or flagellar assembly|nr:P-loop NTPase [Coriobacteriales bacterium]